MTDIFEALTSNHPTGKILTVGLTIPSDQGDEAIRLSKIVAERFKEEFILDSKVNIPYVRLYETVFPNHNIPKVTDAVKNISIDMLPLPMKWEGLEIEVHNVIIWGKLNEDLRLFHQAVLETLNPLREGNYKQKYRNNKVPLFDEYIDSLHKWGSPWAENYIPHMIIAKAENRFEVNKLLDLEWTIDSCTLPAIIVGEKNPHGAFNSIHSFPFMLKE